ncbi:MAG: hypothetical protein WD512_16720 [Candidatus Paceibacterota bacterium]
MAKVYKATIYIADPNNDVSDLIDLNDMIENELGEWKIIKVAESKESEEFNWDDDLMINKIYSQVDDYEEYFKDK